MQRSLCLAVLFLASISGVPAYGGLNDLKDEGVGTYTDPSVANQISNFTINRQMVSCGVGTVAFTPEFSGPFAMLMFARDITHYHANHLTKTIRASGRMISITHVSGVEIEREEHDFIAIAKDNVKPDQAAPLKDRFDIHFRTTFWNTANPLCTPSTEVSGGCRFGGELVASGPNQMGDITVGP
jgi:hypothetical protein